MAATGEVHAENEFLKDQVRRLSLELGRLQAGPASLPDYAGVGELPEWVTNKEMMSPLMTAYERRIGELQRNVEDLRNDNSRFQPELQRLIAENERLRAEYREALRGPAATGRGVAQATMADSQELQERLDLLMSENDVLTDQQREALAEIERFQREQAQQAQEATAMRAELATLRQANRDGTLRAESLGRERQQALDELTRTQQELDGALATVKEARDAAKAARVERDSNAASMVEYRRLLQELNSRAHADREALSSELGRLRSTEDVAGKQLVELQEEVGSERARADAMEAEAASARAEVAAISSSYRELEGQVREWELRDAGAQERLGAAHARIEDLSSERERLRDAEQAARREAAAAAESMRTLAEEASARKEAALEEARASHVEEVERLEAERQAMETTVQELRRRIDRAARERDQARRRAASGLLATTPLPANPVAVTPSVGGLPGPDGGAGHDDVHGALVARLVAAEEARDVAEREQRSAGLEHRRALAQLEEAKAELEAQVAEAARHQTRLQHELEQATALRLKEMARAAEAEAETAAARRAAESSRRLAEKAASDFARDRGDVEEAGRRRIDALKESHARAIAELEGLLHAQEALSERYRAESQRKAADRSAGQRLLDDRSRSPAKLQEAPSVQRPGQGSPGPARPEAGWIRERQDLERRLRSKEARVVQLTSEVRAPAVHGGDTWARPRKAVLTMAG